MRKLDSMGRICIPKNIREAYNITENTDLQVIDNGNGILVIPSNRPYILTTNNMDTLREVYLQLKESGLLDNDYIGKLSKMTKETDMKCPECKSKMFLLSDNTYKCYKCK